MTSGWMVLATKAPSDADTGGEGPGIVAFLIIVALGVACWLLYRSLRRHLRRISFDDGVTPRPRGLWPDQSAPPTSRPGARTDEPRSPPDDGAAPA